MVFSIFSNNSFKKHELNKALLFLFFFLHKLFPQGMRQFLLHYLRSFSWESTYHLKLSFCGGCVFMNFRIEINICMHMHDSGCNKSGRSLSQHNIWSCCGRPLQWGDSCYNNCNRVFPVFPEDTFNRPQGSKASGQSSRSRSRKQRTTPARQIFYLLIFLCSISISFKEALLLIHFFFSLTLALFFLILKYHMIVY